MQRMQRMQQMRTPLLEYNENSYFQQRVLLFISYILLILLTVLCLMLIKTLSGSCPL